ncbi:VOC family protein [Antribacter sp. KLBMP9083]|uniref:VOC family protein n=1 Tax=Antribacter soli TaxID=2910976 RepID=A0AA41QFB4_9MICO|nr:VOC family protein [Antribacter soli]MCF4122404.1 VOC family protein [Antribacter soli]
MIDHVSINCADLSRAKAFYDAVLGTLGISRQRDFGEGVDFGEAVGYGTEGQPDFWLGRFDDMGPNREIHVAFRAKDAAAVRAFYDAALAFGAEPLHAPRVWPEYHQHYFAAYVRDPDGNNVEAVTHSYQGEG